MLSNDFLIRFPTTQALLSLTDRLLPEVEDSEPEVDPLVNESLRSGSSRVLHIDSYKGWWEVNPGCLVSTPLSVVHIWLVRLSTFYDNIWLSGWESGHLLMTRKILFPRSWQQDRETLEIRPARQRWVEQFGGGVKQVLEIDICQLAVRTRRTWSKETICFYIYIEEFWLLIHRDHHKVGLMTQEISRQSEVWGVTTFLTQLLITWRLARVWRAQAFWARPSLQTAGWMVTRTSL